MELKKSTHRVEVVPVVLEKHPQADRLSIVKVYGYTCVVATDQWVGRALAAYIPPDTLCDTTRPEFSFLAEHARADGLVRVKAKKLRGVLSFGLLVPAPAGSREGDDVSGVLGTGHYEPAPAGGQNNRGGLFTGGEVAPAPAVYAVKYDLEAGRRYAQVTFRPGEPVVVTEKLHGANARYVFQDGKMHCGSRTEWKKEYPSYDHVTVESLVASGKVDEERAKDIVARLKAKAEAPQKNMWWQALDNTPALRAFCEKHPGLVVYGEVFGAVQDLNYGRKKGEVSFAAFDMMRDGRWLDAGEFFGLCVGWGVPHVPLLNDHHKLTEWGALPSLAVKAIAYDFDEVCRLAEGKTLVPGASHVREGVVVRPLKERSEPAVGRAVLKFVGAGYLERSPDAEVSIPCPTAE